MTPAARVQAAIEIVDEWTAGDEGLDRVLTRWGRAHRFAGSGDRRTIADLVYDAVRRMRSAAWVAGAPKPAADGRAVVRGSLMLDGADLDALFCGERHAPARLEAHEAPGAARPLADASPAVRLDYPDWLAPDLAALDPAVLEALRTRAPLDLRVNLLKATPEAAMAALRAEGLEIEPGPLSPTALRITADRHRLARSGAYLDGLVEIQDAASQAAADLADARPGETVLDLCAGGGGKALALAAAMRGEGRLYTHDIAPQRIAALPARAIRAGADITIVETAQLPSLARACDLVFVDAPCSGSGAWRRTPDSKWRLTASALAGLAAEQDALLDQAVRFLRPGGRIVYATCSILSRENERRVSAFLRRVPGWQIERQLSLTPLDGADGFFCASIGARAGARSLILC